MAGGGTPTPHRARLLSAAEMQRMKKEDLIKALQEAQKDRENDHSGDIQRDSRENEMLVSMQEMKDEMTNLRKINEKILSTLHRVDNLEEEVAEIKEENKQLRDAMSNQLGF